MAKEIERKFTVIHDGWKAQATASSRFRQGYMGNDDKASIRVRLENDRAFLNIKSATLGIQRHEYEYEIPVSDAEEMLDQLCRKPLIEKVRHFVEFEGNTWEVDVFEGDNAGLVVAEIELEDEQETFSVPDWAGEDVSHDTRYYNVCLVKHPYKDWS
ncbi:MAG: CYTH domain-containing protein [Gammaproteobacteria bacterium]|nr:CYTH domain-containing protein [Gammaproteobacteria bacterium]